MASFFDIKDISSPPSTPPHHRPLQRQRSSYIVDGADVIKDRLKLDYIGKIKSTFQQLPFQQRRFFLSEILECCDNSLLQYVYTFIAPKLKIDFLEKLPMELALHVLSFIDDPQTLTRASHVSHHWNTLLKDEGAWKALCLKYQYRLRHATSYRDFFRHRYNIDTAWSQGGRLVVCDNQIGNGLATCLQMDDTFTVVGCDNNHIEVYNSHTGKYVRSLVGHEGGVWALQFIKTHTNQHILVTGGCDRTARVWDLATGELLHVLRGHVSTIRCLRILNHRIAVTGSRDTTLCIWDIERGELKHVCTGHQSSVRCLEVFGRMAASGSYDATARLWDIETGECVHEFVGHHSQIYAIAFDGTRVVTGSLDSNIRVWSAETGYCLATLQGHTSLVGHLQLSNDILVSGGSDGCLRVWDMANNNFECKHRISAHDNSVTCLQFDNKRILSGGSDGRVKLWHMANGTLIRTFTEDARTVWKVHMSDSKAVVILQRDQQQETTVSPHHTVIELHDFDVDDIPQQ